MKFDIEAWLNSPEFADMAERLHHASTAAIAAAKAERDEEIRAAQAKAWFEGRRVGRDYVLYRKNWAEYFNNPYSRDVDE